MNRKANGLSYIVKGSLIRCPKQARGSREGLLQLPRQKMLTLIIRGAEKQSVCFEGGVEYGKEYERNRAIEDGLHVLDQGTAENREGAGWR